MLDDATVTAIRKMLQDDATQAQFPEHSEAFFHMLETGDYPALKLDPVTRLRIAVAARMRHPDMPLRLLAVAALIAGVALI